MNNILKNTENLKDSIINDSILKDTIPVIKEVIEEVSLYSWCFNNKIVCVFIIIISVVVIYSIYNKLTVKYNISKEQVENKNDVSNDFGVLFKKINEHPEAEKMYKDLIKLSHPDRFPNDKNKNKIANEITSLLGKNKLDLDKLKSLQLRIQNELLDV
jgi:hypothetical protein